MSAIIDFERNNQSHLIFNELEPKFSITPVGYNSNRIYARREHVLLGISPFNGYFNEKNLLQLFDWAFSNFEDVDLFIPDQISKFTFMALDYTPERAEQKTRRQDNYLKNKVIRVLKNMDLTTNYITQMIKTYSDISENTAYQEIYNSCVRKFAENNEFNLGCLSASAWVLSNRGEKNNIGINGKLNIAVEYFLRELPLFINTPQIIQKKSSLFVYHSIPSFLEKLYSEGKITSENQGFLKVILQ
jgi:cyclo(L-tyrosyl-L-tyrosyl) synthase